MSSFEFNLESVKDNVNDGWNSLTAEARNLAFTSNSDQQIRNIPLNAAEMGMGGVLIAGGLIGRGKLGLVAGVAGLGLMGLGTLGLFNFEKSTFDKIGNFLNS